MSQSANPFWRQAWELTVTYQVSSDDTATQNAVISTDSVIGEPLRITFEVLQSTVASPWWFADIVVYNMSEQTRKEIALNAVKVTLKAGFQIGPALSSVIWSGPVLQVLFDQENIVDSRVTFHCVSNPLVMENMISFSMGPYASQAQLMAKAADRIGLPPMDLDQGTLSQYASTVTNAKKYPRGNTVFGKMGSQLNRIAKDQNLNTYRDGSKAYMTEVSAGETVPVADLSYAVPNPLDTTSGLSNGVTQSIIGTPRQFPEGVIFTVLLDPRLQVQLPVLVVHLAGLPLISQQTAQLNSSIATPLNANLLFFVGQVRHVGDSRGNDWYTEVTGYNTTYGTDLLNGIFNANSSS